MIEIIKSVSENVQQRFVFGFREYEMVLFLDRYSFEERATKRHKYKSKQFYDRLAGFWSTQSQNYCSVDKVPLTDEIKKEAWEKFTSQIKVEVWRDKV